MDGCLNRPLDPNNLPTPETKLGLLKFQGVTTFYPHTHP